MKDVKILLTALGVLALALPVLAWTYKSTYPIPCSQIWPAVKETLSNPENYVVHESDDAQMAAAYQVKHQVHANISGAVLQRTNKVKLVAKGAGCEMQIVSNYSGWEHDDKGDFKKRVDEILARPKDAKPPEPAKAADAAKPAEPRP
jgi:hypothetical protein